MPWAQGRPPTFSRRFEAIGGRPSGSFCSSRDSVRERHLASNGVTWIGISRGSEFKGRSSETRITTGALVSRRHPRSRRSVVVPISTVETLRRHRSDQAEERLRQGPEYSADLDLVFANGRGDPLDYRVVVQRHFKPIVKAAGLEPLRPYDLRHTCATLLLAGGEHPKVVAERLGHSSTVMTMDVYSHVLPDMQEAAADKLEGLLFGA